MAPESLAVKGTTYAAASWPTPGSHSTVMYAIVKQVLTMTPREIPPKLGDNSCDERLRPQL